MARRREDENTIAFLRVAAIQLPELAEIEPSIARDLRHVASQLDAEAADIEARATDPG